MNSAPVAGYLSAAFLSGVLSLLALASPAAAQPPVAQAGDDFSVNEGDTVFLGATGSSGAAPLGYSWTQMGGALVAMAGANTATPSFVAPDVALGGETLSFRLTVNSGGVTATDIVNITVVNMNHPPVADAGENQIVAVGAAVTLRGEDSFDIDGDPFTRTWVQTGGPTVILAGADGAHPSFEALFPGFGGKDGVVAELTFELLVGDGYPMDAPAPGYDYENVIDSVTVTVTSANNPPTANAGPDLTVAGNSEVPLDGTASTDPECDALTYAWIQETGGIPVVLRGADTATPSFVAPFVAEASALVFTLTVSDGYGGSSSSSVCVNVLDEKSPPLAITARPTVAELWPPNHSLVPVRITGLADEGAEVSIAITGITQDEPAHGTGQGDTAIDAVIGADGTALLRSERSGKGDGRVYHIHFTATNAHGLSSGTVRVCVPLRMDQAAADGGAVFDSTR